MSELERAYLLNAFDSNWIAPVGPDLDAFESSLGERTGRLHVAALSSGTAALRLGLLLAGVEPGDGVLVSTLTFVATANAALHAGGIPVFVDTSPEIGTSTRTSSPRPWPIEQIEDGSRLL